MSVSSITTNKSLDIIAADEPQTPRLQQQGGSEIHSEIEETDDVP
jgi:hypothetical protein